MQSYDFNIRHLKILTEINENDSLRFIADKCGISQPALSQAVNKIEHNVNAKILLRTTRGTVLTKEGHILKYRAQRFFDYLDLAQEEIWDFQKKQENKKNLTLKKSIHRVNMIDIASFMSLYKTNSYFLTSQKMQITEASVYRTLKNLELKIGALLFVKIDKAIKATFIAKKLAKSFKLAINELQAAIDDIDFFSKANHKIHSINIGTLSLPKYRLIPKTLASFAKQYPSTLISVMDGSYDNLLNDLLNGEIDLFVGALRDSEITGITQTPLFSEGLYIVARYDHPLTKQDNILPEQWQKYSWILPPKGSPTYKKLIEFYKINTLQPPFIQIQCGSVSVILNMLREGNWLTLLSKAQFQHFEEVGLVSRIGDILPSSERKIGIFTRADWHPSVRQAALVTLLKNTT